MDMHRTMARRADPQIRRRAGPGHAPRLAAGHAPGWRSAESTDLPQPAQGAQHAAGCAGRHVLAAQRHVGGDVQVQARSGSRAIPPGWWARHGRRFTAAASTRSRPGAPPPSPGGPQPGDHVGAVDLPAPLAPSSATTALAGIVNSRSIRAAAPDAETNSSPDTTTTQPPRSGPRDHNRRHGHQQHRQRHRGAGPAPGRSPAPGFRVTLPRSRRRGRGGSPRTHPVTGRRPARHRRPGRAAAAAWSPATTTRLRRAPGNVAGHRLVVPPGYARPLQGDHRNNSDTVPGPGSPRWC